MEDMGVDGSWENTDLEGWVGFLVDIIQGGGVNGGCRKEE